MTFSRLTPALGLFLLALTGLGQIPATKAQATAAYDHQLLAFQPNRGQAASTVQYLSHGRDYSILLEPTAATLVLAHTASRPGHSTAPEPLKTESIRMILAGANPAAAMTSGAALPGYVSYLNGNQPDQWQTGIPTYAAARIAQPYPGIDLVFYGNQRNLEYDFLVAPNADPSRIRLNLAGAKPVLQPTGELRLQAAATPADTDIVFHKPILYQTTGAQRTPVDGAFTLAKNGEVSFRIGPYDHSRQLVIDPVISYATYFGGPAEDEVNGIAINAANQLYAVGQSFSTTLPSIAGEYETTLSAGKNGHEAFVTKFSADGSQILWTTFLGGSQDDFATAVAVNSSDQPYVVGYTNSCVGTSGQPAVFPFTADGVQTLCNPNANSNNTAEVSSNNGYDAFMVKLSSDGKSLLYGTYLGGSTGNDFANAIVLDATGRPYITGQTFSTIYFYAIASNYSDSPSYPVNQHGAAGYGSSNFPTTANAFYTNTTESKLYVQNNPGYYNQGPQDEQGFITILAADLHSMVYSSLIGGTDIGGCGNGACNTNSYAVAVNAAGQAFIGGNTSSAHWPVTTGAFAPACSNSGATGAQCYETGWLAGFDPTKSGAASLLFTTYINGTSAGLDGNNNNLLPGSDVFGLITDSSGNIIVTGDTNADNFPTTAGTFQPACTELAGNGNAQKNTCSAAFLTKLTPTGSTIWSTYYGGTTPSINYTIGRGLAVDASNNVYLVGSGDDGSLPLLRPFASAPGGNPDFFFSEFSSDGKTLLAGTWVGIGGGMTANNGMAIDSSQNVYFSGSQNINPYGGTSFPVSSNAADKSQQGTDGIILKLITQPSTSTTALTITPTTATPTTSIGFTATVTGNTAGATPTGTITLSNGATTLGTITLAAGTGTFSSTLAAGTYSVIATYSGDGTYNASATTAQTVTVLNTPSVVLTATPTSVTTGTAVALSAKVSSSAGTPTGTVIFFDGTSMLGSAPVTGGTATYSATSLAAGTHTLTAQYQGDTNFSPLTSNAQTVTVTAPVVAVADTLVVTSSALSAAAKAPVTFTATFTYTGTTATPSGSVTFLDGTTSLGTGTISGNSATLTTSALAVGPHNISAAYAGDTNFGKSSSAAITETITQPSLILSANPSSLTILHGSTGSLVITATSAGGYTGSAALSCGNLPQYVSCSFSPATLNLTASGGPMTSTLTIKTAQQSAALVAPSRFSQSFGETLAFVFWLPGSVFALFKLRKKGLNLLSKTVLLTIMAVLSLGTLASLIGCGGSQTFGTAAIGTDTITVNVTAADGSMQSLSVAVTIQ